MPKTQKNKFHKQNRKKKAIAWKIPSFWKYTLLALVFLGVCFFFSSWWIHKEAENRYPIVYARWWKAALRLEEDALEEKIDINHAQDWLNASQQLLRWNQRMSWTHPDKKSPFPGFQDFFNQVDKKPDKVFSRLETIRSVHQNFYQYHMRQGLTKPIFLADRIWIEWNHLKTLLQEDAHADTIHESLQFLNLQIPILEPYWLRSDIADFTALNDSLEKLWLNQHFDEMFQLLVDNDAILIRACLDASY